MDQAGYSTALVFNLKKDSPFSFKCQVCSACCHNKSIRITPYEAFRLARNLGTTTTEVYRLYIEKDRTTLRNKPDGSCIFLDSRGCGVHPDRPLVCRLFPLGQISDGQGSVKYASMPLHPDCLGLFGTEGTVDSYLASQGTLPYFRYDQVYSGVFRKIKGTLTWLQHAGQTRDQASGPEASLPRTFPPRTAGSYPGWTSMPPSHSTASSRNGKSHKDRTRRSLSTFRPWRNGSAVFDQFSLSGRRKKIPGRAEVRQFKISRLRGCRRRCIFRRSSCSLRLRNRSGG